MDNMENVIVTKGVKKGFTVGGGDTFWALKGLDLEIKRGQLDAVLLYYLSNP